MFNVATKLQSKKLENERKNEKKNNELVLWSVFNLNTKCLNEGTLIVCETGFFMLVFHYECTLIQNKLLFKFVFTFKSSHILASSRLPGDIPTKIRLFGPIKVPAYHNAFYSFTRSSSIAASILTNNPTANITIMPLGMFQDKTGSNSNFFVLNELLKLKLIIITHTITRDFIHSNISSSELARSWTDETSDQIKTETPYHPPKSTFE